MKIVFVGDRPSRLNTDPDVAFVGTPSFKNLQKWIDRLQVSDYTMVNSYGRNMGVYRTLRDWQYYLRSYPNNKYEYDVFIALGNNASKALGDIPHFRLPHPSPRNRKLNDQSYIDSELEKCYLWLKDR